MSVVPEPPPLQLAHGRLDLERRRWLHADGETRLSANEVGLLRYLLARPGRAVPRGELLTQVWGYRPGLRTRAVDQCVSRLRNKIEVDPRHPRYLRSVYGKGYVFDLGRDPCTPETAAAVRMADPRRGNLPAIEGPLVGRDEVMAQLIDVVTQPGARAIVTGPPGVGKTRVALETALSTQPRMTGGAWLVAVERATTLGRLAAAIVAALDVDLDITATWSQQARRLGAVIAARGDALFVLDACEGLGRAAWAWLAEVQAVAPGARWLFTARRPVARSQARPVPLAPLPTPDAIRLYLQLATRKRPTLAHRPPGDPLLEELAHRLDGLPLAIELAAALAAAQGPDELLLRLRTDPSANLAGVDRLLLRCWATLSPLDQHHLASLAIFPGPFRTDAAAALLGTTEAVVPLIASGLLVRHGPRLALLHQVRAFAMARLKERPDWLQHAERAAQDWAVTFSEQRIAALETGARAEARQDLRELRPTLEALLARARGRRRAVALSLGLALDELMRLEGPHERRIPACEGLVEEARDLDETPSLVRALLRLGEALTAAGDHLDAAERAAEAVALCESFDDPALLLDACLLSAEVARHAGRLTDAARWIDRADALRPVRTADGVRRALARGRLCMEMGRVEEADRLLLAAVRGARRRGPSRLLARTLVNLATLCISEGRLEEAERRLTESDALLDALGAQAMRGSVLGNLGTVRYDRGDLEGAEAAYASALAVARSSGDRRAELNLLCWRASLAHDRACHDEARHLLGQAFDLLRELPNPRTEGYAHAGLAAVELDAGDLATALAACDRALACFHDADDRYGAANVGLIRAALLAELGETERAAVALEASRAAAGDPPPELIATVSSIFEGAIELARAASTQDPAAAAALRRSARARLSLGDDRTECRLARRVVRRMLGED